MSSAFFFKVVGEHSDDIREGFKKYLSISSPLCGRVLTIVSVVVVESNERMSTTGGVEVCRSITSSFGLISTVSIFSSWECGILGWMSKRCGGESRCNLLRFLLITSLQFSSSKLVLHNKTWHSVPSVYAGTRNIRSAGDTCSIF